MNYDAKNILMIFTSWMIGELTKLNYEVFVDNEIVFEDIIDGAVLNSTWDSWELEGIWEIWWSPIWEDPIWWDINEIKKFTPFDMEADTGRIYQSGIRIRIEITSISQIQDFVIDTLWIIAEQTPFNDIRNKF